MRGVRENDRPRTSVGMLFTKELQQQHQHSAVIKSAQGHSQETCTGVAPCKKTQMAMQKVGVTSILHCAFTHTGWQFHQLRRVDAAGVSTPLRDMQQV